MARFLNIRGSHGGRVLNWIFGFSDFSNLGPDLGLSIRGILRNIYLMHLDVLVTVLEFTRGPFATFMVHMVVGIFVGFWIFGIPRLESKRSACRQGGVIHTRMVAGQPCRQPSRGNHGWRFTARIQTAERFERNCVDTAI